MALLRLEDLPIKVGTRVLMRVDFNVPIADADVTDDTRIRESLPTLQYLLERQARIILVSHLGRPRGKIDPALTLKPVARRLETLLGQPVLFCPTTVGPEAEKRILGLQPGSVALMENLRFDPGEEANDPVFAANLARLGDVYVNDAFGTAHRAHASTVGVPSRLPSAAGRLMERELWALTEILGKPKRPYWAIIGGSKVSDKIKLLRSLLSKVDGLIIGGGMANTFLTAKGYHLGRSQVEQEAVDQAVSLIRDADRQGLPLVLPEDLVVADDFRSDASARVVTVEDVAPNELALDIGPETVDQMRTRLKDARTVFWNGPLGVFEWDRFAQGTMAVARILGTLSAEVVVGGGDSVAAVAKSGQAARLTHISTGGGAALEFLEGVMLPGVQALEAADD